MTFPTRLLLALLGGACYGLPFVEPRLALLAFIGLAPALLVLCPPRDAPGVRATCGLILTTTSVGILMVALPLSRMSAVALIMMAVLIGMWSAPAIGVFVVLRRRTGWPMALLWPCCWIVAEWTWSFHTVGRLAFGLSGYTQFIYPRLIQIADVTGVLGVSFLVQLVVGALADVGFAAWRDGFSTLRRRRTLAPLGAAVAALLLALLYGTFRLATARAEPGPRLAMVQPAVPHEFNPLQVARVQHAQLGLARRQVSPGEADLVVFPENAVLSFIEGSNELAQFTALSETLRAPLLVGVYTRTAENLALFQAGKPEKRFQAGGRSFRRGHNSAAIIAQGGLVDRYDKIHLMAFTEEPPGEDLFRSLSLLEGYRAFIVRRLGYIGTAVPGDGVKLLNIPGSDAPPFWAPICFEQADARLSREAANAGARYFINITSEGDLSPQIYWNTAAVAVMRAVELHVGIARCGNMGITGIIDPWGRQTHHLRGRGGSLWDDPGVLKARVPLGPKTTTLYARLGDWPAGAAALAMLAAAVLSFRLPRSRS